MVISHLSHIRRWRWWCDVSQQVQVTPLDHTYGSPEGTIFFLFFKFVWWPIFWVWSTLLAWFFFIPYSMSHEKEKKKIPSYCLFSYMKNKIRRSDLNYGSAAEINISPLATHRFCIQLCLRCEMLLFFFRKVFSKLQEDLIYYCQSVKIDWDKTYNYNKGRNYRFNFWHSSVVISCQQSLTRCKNQLLPICIIMLSFRWCHVFRGWFYCTSFPFQFTQVLLQKSDRNH